MKPAAERLAAKLADTPFAAPAIPVINNIDVAATDDPTAIRDALYRQAFGPVRWVETVQAMAARGVATVIECGPGKAPIGHGQAHRRRAGDRFAGRPRWPR